MTQSHFIAAGILSVFVLYHAAAYAAPQGGQLIFRGEILNAPCPMRVDHQNLISSCLQALPSKQDIVSVTQSGNRTFSSRAGALSLKWTNRRENAGVLTVSVP